MKKIYAYKIRPVHALGVFLSLAICLMSKAQTSNFSHFGVENGMTQTQVQTLVQDDNGNLWIGTMAGLTKYNGREFVAYRKDDGLAEDWVTSSYKDESGNIWLGHWRGSVSKINVDDKDHFISTIELDQFGQFKTITSIIQDKDGNMWFGTEGYGIFVYDGTTKIKVINEKKSGLPSDYIYALCNDPNGNVWIGTDKGLAIYHTGEEMMSDASYMVLDTSTGLSGTRINTIALLGENEMWIGTEHNGVNIIDLSKGLKLENGQLDPTILGHLSVKNGMASNNVTCIAKDFEKKVWIGSRDEGVSVFTPEVVNMKRTGLDAGTIKAYGIKQGLNYYRINSIIQDREHNMWVGTDIGLNQYRGEMFQIFDEDYGLINNIVWSILHDTHGNVWVGTNGGASRLPADSIVNHVRDDSLFVNYTTKKGLSSNVILSLHEDNFGNIWMGTKDGGACRLSRSRNGKEVIDVFNKANGLSDNTVYAINSDHEGNIWFGTKDGATKYDAQKKTFTTYSVKDGLGGNVIYTIYKDSKGSLWFGVLGGDLTHYDGYEFRTFDETDGLDSKFILCITEDEKNNIWFGAYGGGLFRYDGDKFTNYSVKDGLTSDSPYLLVCDDMNNLWIGTSQGIDKFDQKNNRFSHYGKQEGFLGIETNRNAVFKDNKGGIWFGTIMGAVKYNPSKNRFNRQEPIVSLDGLKIFHKDAEFPPDKAEFQPDQNHLTFFFTGVSLTNPEKVRYRFLMEGEDKGQSPEYAENYAVYSNLGPGHYTFKVWACNGDKVCTKEPATFSFTILTPYYQTWWFFTLCIITVVILFYIIVTTRTRNLQRIRVVLEEQVDLRTRQLQQRNKDIMDSIRYAKRIQEAILPAKEVIRRTIPESVIYYKPKDIVSGDFYWVENKKDKVLFAAVDCTGHGVPGAFMSIVGHNILKNAVDEHQKTIPATILDEMNRGVSETLQQSYEDSSVKDGMDIALCAYDRRTGVLEFAGAYNALYHIRNGQLSVIKGDKFPVGIFVGEKMKKFTNHQIEIQKGDVVYIASDGYADQFGGPKGKKFKYQRFQQLLLDIYKKNPRDQYDALDKSIMDWMGNEYEQIDDILVMGVMF
ncbi:MAG: SpoIIE family protein phosphatase [Flavobacteriales bacterium]|nr:SpoIIE family protein phosphatase [Flavobacteriales bacterium]